MNNHFLSIRIGIMLNIALFGPPGSGKGTQAGLLVKEYGLFHISTGDILRREIEEETPLGLKAKKKIEAGRLISNETIVKIIEKTIINNPEATGYLFDGFPRTYIQAYILEGLMARLHKKLCCLISLEIPDDVSISRLIKRGQTSGRSDDNEETIRKRLKEYYDKTLPVMEYFKKVGNYFPVNGEDTVENIHHKIKEIINRIQNENKFNIN